ncbi:ATP-binding cassette, subfamily C, CydD [Micrococcales bacterium KH10]|nr:ATP-binding cassette, subfamily C, CydD [Micrococcales bacterium KH10]
MKPLDPKLLRTAAPARRYVLLTAALGVITAALVIAQCLLIAHALAPVVDRTADLGDVTHLIGWLAVVLFARVVVSWCQERFGQRAGVEIVADLRAKVVDRAVRLGPRWLDRGHRTDVVTLATRGLDDLQPYLTRYLPQLLLAVTVTPGALMVVLGLDWVAAVIIAGTLPLIPLFMWLVGLVTQEATERRQRAMSRLGSQVLDLVAGIPTLRALRREHGPTQRVRDLSNAYRRSTMGTLRIAFLSGMVLELLTTLSVAIVAVAVGLRLVHGGLDLTTGLAVIMLAPEVYLPVRQIGTQFHASADGIAASAKAFEILETIPEDAAAARRISDNQPSGGRGNRAGRSRHSENSGPRSQVPPLMPSPDLTSATIVLDKVSVAVPGTARYAPHELSVRIEPGTVTVLAGANGAGKSTAVNAILGIISPTAGQIAVCPSETDAPPVDLADIDMATWQSQIAWLPQRPWMRPGTIAENVGFDPDELDPARAEEAAALTGLDEVLTSRQGWNTSIGTGGTGLSVGQRQRVALTRLLLTDKPLVIVDEPTAHLDEGLAEVVVATLTQLRDQGRTVIAITHRDDVTPLADTVVEVCDG